MSKNKKTHVARKSKVSKRLGVAVAIRKTLVEIIDNVIAGAFTVLAVDMVVPSIGDVARLQVLFAVAVLFAVNVYLRDNE